ncbi:MerR family transcriptional regulator [Mesorhizobium sp. YC-39]|uniref:MerR family transcriptional regulator n=1 Tax=unclassified Mesorhizobium TaxID=325217 RepID=UPI0021E831E4|nr:MULTISPECIES: MerR family transcriptional regulator [unclassified Mesorhizobium]MCV3211552.1 MerR family transcriptional regulator [Mesorhizobium sp. YC-2]MCV3233250.1 MerR family transcriptional regulator [Mesorhizobium sp. YC-39]
MPLEFDGRSYRTIQDVKDRYRVSEKSLRRWAKAGLIPEPDFAAHGGRVFRHYSDDWCTRLEQFLNSKRAPVA